MVVRFQNKGASSEVSIFCDIVSGHKILRVVVDNAWWLQTLEPAEVLPKQVCRKQYR
jgi:hypothetical protein